MTAPFVLFPNAADAVATYLTGALDQYRDLGYVDGVVVDTIDQKPRPQVFVHLERVGGVRTLPSVDQPRIEVQVWHQTDAEAHDLGQLVRALVHQMQGTVGDVVVTRVIDVAGLFRSPDPQNNRPRYRFAVEIGMHNIELASSS